MVRLRSACHSSPVADSEEKGKFSTEIGAEVIRAALESVRKHTGDAAPGEVSVDVEGDEVATLKTQLELSLTTGRDLMGKVKDSHEKMLRAVADLENFKKRAQKEKEEVQKFGLERLLKDFLPVLDNFDRALAHASSEASSDATALRQGVELVRKQFEDALGRHGVKGFSAVGQMFDPRLHEAMQQVVTAGVPPNQVVSEIARGFMLNDRLVRPAMVAVAVAPPANQPPSEPS
jgi:molecular chaperone GrpE